MIGWPSSSFFLNNDIDHPPLDMATPLDLFQVRDEEPMPRVSHVAPNTDYPTRIARPVASTLDPWVSQGHLIHTVAISGAV